MAKLVMAPRARCQLDTKVTVYHDSGKKAVEYGPDEIADLKMGPSGVLEIYFTDWSFITYSPGWKWIVREKQ